MKQNVPDETGIMMDRKERQAQTRSLSGKIPFNRLLGIEIKRFHPDGVTLTCKVRADLLNSQGALHGGVAATLADAAVGIAIHYLSAETRPISTVDLKVNYFQPVREGVLRARARLLRMGSRLCVGRVDLTNVQGDAMGTAIATYAFLDTRRMNSQG